MNIKEMVRKDYAEYIAMHGKEYPAGLIESLKSQERVPAFMDNISRELIGVERKRRVKLDRMKIKNVVYEMTRMFLTMVMKHADEKALSLSEQTRIVTEANKKATITDEVAQEYIKELTMDNVIITDERSKY